MSITKTFRIDSIDGGISPTLYNAPNNSFLGAIGIDPDLTIDGGLTVKTSGAIVPVGYAKFSSTGIDNPVIKIITNPKNELIYAVTTGGTIVSYSNILGAETVIGTVAGSHASGADYYNNYLYITGTGAGQNDVSRYGPLDGVAAITNAVWTGATLGAQPATGTTTYVQTRQMPLPNHWMHVHQDSLYFCDYNSPTYPGRGSINLIRTTKTAVEGDTNFGSATGVLLLPLNAPPTCIESYGNDIAISTIAGQSTQLDQGRSAVYFWDTFSDAWYNQVTITDPLATALYNTNNILYLFSGNTNNGFRISSYAGGKSFTSIASFEDGCPPFPGAVDSYADRISFGGFTTFPEASASVFSIGSKDGRIPRVLHNTARSSATGANPVVTAINYYNQASNITPRIVMAFKDNSSQGIDSLNSGSLNALWRSKVFNTEGRFVIRKIWMPLTNVTGAAWSIVPAIYTDDLNGQIYTLDTINSTNFPGRRNICYKNPKMAASPFSAIQGNHNFAYELRFSGSQVVAVTFPIKIEVEIFEDDVTH